MSQRTAAAARPAAPPQAVFNAAARMAVRALSIGSSEPMAAILFSMGSVSAVCAAITLGALRVFAVPHGWQDWSILLSAGVFGYLYQVTLTAGLQRADAAPAVAMSYLGWVGSSAPACTAAPFSAGLAPQRHVSLALRV